MKEIVIIPATVDNRIFGITDKLLRVASYSRVSTNSEEQMLSFNTQKTYYTDLILKTKGWKLAGTYADEGISGVTEKKRPDFLRMIRHCKAGKIDLIITKSISRFSRNVVHAVDRVRMLKAIGVGVYFEKENINTLEESSEFVLSLLCSIAQEESHSLSLNVRRGMQMRMQNGHVTWNYKQGIGFRKDEDGNPEIIPEHAIVIRKIFREFLSGESRGSIAEMLNREKALFQFGKKKWSSAYIAKTLKNERYCGDVILQKTYIESHLTKKQKVNNGEFPKIHIKNNHPAIISRDEFEKAALNLAKRNNQQSMSKKAKTYQGKYSSKYALNRILVCGDCGTLYQRRTWTKKATKEKQGIWRCFKRLEYGTRYCNSSPTLDEKSLHEAIANAIEKVANTSNNIIDFTSRELIQTLKFTSFSDFDLEFTQNKIDNITQEISEIIASGKAVENISHIQKLNQEAVRLNELINQNNDKISEPNSEICETINQIKQKNAPLEYNDKLVRQIISSIKVINSRKIIVQFKNGAIVEQEVNNRVKPKKSM
ncbi:MAG: recombinase family protein [Clostridia bacterium]